MTTLDETTLWLASTASVAKEDGKAGLAGVASRALDNYRRLLRIEKAARVWAEARKEDARLTERSIIPTAQALLDALNDES